MRHGADARPALGLRRCSVLPLLSAHRRSADAIAFGRLFIANPDLVARIKKNQTLNAYDRSTFYGGGAHGYTDYQTLAEQSLAAAI